MTAALAPVEGYSVEETPLGTLVTFPSGDAFYYVDEPHAYYRVNDAGKRGRRLTSVSSLCKPFDFDPKFLIRWAVRVTCEGIAILCADPLSQEDPEEIRQGLHFLSTSETILAALTESKLRHEDHRGAKANIGTEVHEALEALAYADAVAIDVDSPAAGYKTSLMRWWEENWPEPLQVEQFIYSAEHGYTGRFDLRARLRDGRIALLDLKTSGYIGPSYHAQLEGYELAARECGIGASDERLILQVHEDGEIATAIPSKLTGEDFLNGVAVYRAAGAVRR